MKIVATYVCVIKFKCPREQNMSTIRQRERERERERERVYGQDNRPDVFVRYFLRHDALNQL